MLWKFDRELLLRMTMLWLFERTWVGVTEPLAVNIWWVPWIDLGPMPEEEGLGALLVVLVVGVAPT